MIKLKNILLEQLDTVPQPAPGTYNLRFTVNYRDGNREPGNEPNVQVSDQDVQEFEKNKSLYNLSNEDFWKDISGELSNASPKLISGIKVEIVSAEKPEFSVHIDSVDIDNETISPTPQFSSYEDVKDDMRDLLPDDPNMLTTKARVEGHVKIGDNKYEFNFETQDADDDVEPDQIYWQSDSFEQVTELDETDVVNKLNGISWINEHFYKK